MPEVEAPFQKTRPKTAFVGCRFCIDEWHVWSNTNPQTATIREHLISKHYDKFRVAVLTNKLKGWETFGHAQGHEERNANHSLWRASTNASHSLKSINVIDSPELRDLLLYVGTQLDEDDLPHRTKLTQLIYERFQLELKKLIEELKNAAGPHFMSFGINGQVTMTTRLVAFHYVPGSHSGQNLAKVFVAILKELGIFNRIGMVTLDNASNCGSMMEFVALLLRDMGVYFDKEGNRIRCFPHIINLAVKAGLKQLTKLLPWGSAQDQDDNDDNFEFDDDPATQLDIEADDPYIEILRDDVEFKNTIVEENASGAFGDDGLPVLTLLREMEVRWSSTYLMIDRVLLLYPAIDLFLKKPQNELIAHHALTAAMYSTRAASGSRPLIPPASAGLRTSPPASVLIPPDSSFLHRRIPDSRLIVAPRVPHITIQFLQGKGSLDLFSLDLPLPASCEPASVQGSPLQQNKSPRSHLPLPPPSPLSMPSASDVAPQDPAADPAQEAWRRLTTIEARLEHQDGQMAEIFNTFREFRLYLEQHNTPTVPRDSGPATSFTRGGDRLRPAPPDSFDGEREKGRAFINSCDLYMSLTPDAFPDEQTRINWVLSYMKGGRAARFAARTLRHPNSHGGVPRFGTYAEFRTQFIAEFCPRDEKRKAATTFETSAYHQGSRSVDEYIDEFWDLAEEAQFPDGAQLVFRFRHGLDPRIEAKVANIVEGRPSDERVQEWIDAARRVDYNTRAHQDFRSAVTKPRTAPAPAVRHPGAPAVFRALPAPPPRPAAAAPSAPTAPASRPFPLAFRWTLTCPANVPEPPSSAVDARSPGTSLATARTNSTSAP
ncbi:hypothetical protein LshimejAT787_2500170 [Lyophyllum shimeji]|uniref:Retrotransposon gag domain-containing protein n=1 Tax=Lyophyllum shimeji TaxID=47721 RepID=A0A9P3UV90_LYOSH|nr:hypothetical protein LshimejAT787_2500170 [Lyophyllum shimeji]